MNDIKNFITINIILCCCNFFSSLDTKSHEADPKTGETERVSGALQKISESPSQGDVTRPCEPVRPDRPRLSGLLTPDTE